MLIFSRTDKNKLLTYLLTQNKGRFLGYQRNELKFKQQVTPQPNVKDKSYTN